MQVTPEFIIGILAFCIQVIAAGSYFNVFHGHGRLHGGHSPDAGKWANMNFYHSYSVFCFGITSVLFAVAELGLLLKPEWFGFVESMILRGVVYCIKGIATLGTSGDLGIAAGSMELIIGVVMIVYCLVKGGSSRRVGN